MVVVWAVLMAVYLVVQWVVWLAVLMVVWMAGVKVEMKVVSMVVEMDEMLADKMAVH